MARRMKNWPEQKNTGRKSKYPWEEWTDGSIWKATKDRDFDCEAKSFRQSVTSHAHRNELSVRTHIADEFIVFFQFSKNGSFDG